jgi:hypothetical protein
LNRFDMIRSARGCCNVVGGQAGAVQRMLDELDSMQVPATRLSALLHYLIGAFSLC